MRRNVANTYQNVFPVQAACLLCGISVRPNGLKWSGNTTSYLIGVYQDALPLYSLILLAQNCCVRIIGAGFTTSETRHNFLRKVIDSYACVRPSGLQNVIHPALVWVGSCISLYSSSLIQYCVVVISEKLDQLFQAQRELQNNFCKACVELN